MKKEKITINGQEVVIMEQATSYVLNIEKQFGRNRLAEKCQEILKYPSGVNPKLKDLVNFPCEYKYKDVEISFFDTEKNDYKWQLIQSIMQAYGSVGTPEFFAVGEFIVKICSKKIDDYKFSDLEKIGGDVIEALSDYAYFILIDNTFRKM